MVPSITHIGMERKEGSKINPLILIQLPDKKSNITDKKDEIIKILKNKFGITEENRKLAKWLTDEKSEFLQNIDKPDNDPEHMNIKKLIESRKKLLKIADYIIPGHGETFKAL